MANKSPLLTGPPSDCCFQSIKHTGTPVGRAIKIADVETYLSEPPQGITGQKKVILYFADVFGPFYLNSKLIQDYYASQGYIVLGIDYFLGDTFDLHQGDPNFNRGAWFEKSTTQAREVVPKWFKAVRDTYGSGTLYTAVGYCFGAPFPVELAATEDVVAAAFAHPFLLTEDHIKKLKKPLLLLCAETDSSFPIESRRRAEDILIEKKATYHIQVFSGVQHGFASKGDPTVEHIRWAKEQAARSVIEWFNRFTNNERAYNVFGAESNSSKYQLLMYSVSYRPRYTANGPDKPPSGASNEVLYDKLGNHSLDAAFLFQTFKEVKETKAPAGFIYEDLIGYQLHLGGQRPIVSMKKTPKKQEYVHLRTTGNKEGDAYLRLGQDAPFGFMTAPLPSDTFGRLKKIFYVHDGKLVLESVTFRR